MKKFIEKVEKYLVRIIALAFVALVLVQGLMTNDSMRLYLSWGERMEGQEIEFAVNSAAQEDDDISMQGINSPYAILELSIEKYSSLPKTSILVNGEKQAAFDDSTVQLKLMAGDVIEVDASSYDFPVQINISNISDNLAFPEKDTLYTCNHDIVMIGKIVVK